MTCLRKKYRSNYLAITYEWYLELYPQRKFFKILGEMQKKTIVPLGEYLKSELWARGYVQEPGRFACGQIVRRKLMQLVYQKRVEVRKRKEKRPDLIERNRVGRGELEGWLTENGWMCRGWSQSGSIWGKDRWVVTMGTGWCYVYVSSCSGFNWDAFLRQIAYFQLSGDVIGRMGKALNGELIRRSFLHGQRRMYFLVRKRKRSEYRRKKNNRDRGIPIPVSLRK